MSTFRFTPVVLLVLASCGAPAPPPPPPHAAARPLQVTGAAVALTRLTSDPLDERYPALSPDGHTLLFTAGTFRHIWIPVSTAIVGIDPNSPAARTVFTTSSSWALTSAWLPDSSSFVYETNSTGINSLVRALTAAPGAGVTVVVNGSAANDPGCPSLSSDGTRVAFQTQTNGSTYQVAVANLDGSHLTFLGEGGAPSWSPDGTRLAFQRAVNGANQVFLVDPNTGTNLTQLTSDGENSLPTWSPDGRFLAFQHAPHPHRPGELLGNIFVMHRDGTAVTQLTDAGDGLAWWPFWGHDGWIYFSYYARDSKTSNDIWRLRPGGELAMASAPAQ
jgi:Tol biopolymer transport system component